MQQGARNAAERRPRAAVVREKDKDETVAEHAPTASPSPNRFVPHTPSTTPNNHRNFKRSGVRCHNCQGWGHVQKQCPSPHKTTKALTLNSSPWDSPKPTVLHLKCQSQEMIPCTSTKWRYVLFWTVGPGGACCRCPTTTPSTQT